MLILYETGMRGGELLNLKISDFKRKQRYLKISKSINYPDIQDSTTCKNCSENNY
ncbi:hypothetical protein [Enterobacter cloacae complex sp. 284J4]|uniref:hypothetical protein n=1 Tax=Enterobacter cloacae complex sp. 284J4 TaxID=3395851 RepID=UPI003CF74579